MTRIRQFLQNGMCMGKPVDTVLVFGGTNDSWAGTAVGEPQYADWTEDSLNQVLPALGCVLCYIKEQAPNARIVNLVNTGLSEPLTEGMIRMCKELQVDCVALRDIDKVDGHPTAAGMAAIAGQIAAFLEDRPQ